MDEKLQPIPQKKVDIRNLPQPVKFFAAGVLNTIVGYGLYACFLFFSINYIISVAAANILGILHSFLWHKYWTFRSQGNPGKELAKFTLVYLAAFIINIPLLILLVEKIRLDKYTAQALSIIVIAAISFTGHKFWSFATQKNADSA
jgi:putative flippase GtrA